MVGGWDVCPDVNEGDRKGRPYAGDDMVRVGGYLRLLFLGCKEGRAE